jgi:Fe-coproporphyrin III synthase
MAYGHSLLILRQLSNFVGPFVKYSVFGDVAPILAGYKITNKCNLRCKHCPFWRRSGQEQDFEGIVATMERLRRLGVMILILEGGEPLIWRDGEKTFRDVVAAARNIFPCVCATTNGTIPWSDLPLDRVWVSLDGPGSIHDAIRGDGVFNRVMANLKEAGQGRALVSATISRFNLAAIPDLIALLKGLAAGVTIQFYYPYDGLPDKLFIEPAERAPLLDELILMKKKGYPVANSVASLSEMKQRLWTCVDGFLANAEPDGSIEEGCYLKNRGNADCSKCGFTAHNEMSLAFRLTPGSILCGLKIFGAGSPRRRRGHRENT